MVVELNQHYNSKDRIFDWDELIYELDKIDLDRYDICQGDVKMLFLNRHDHRIY
jgi:hypothetical protein